MAWALAADGRSRVKNGRLGEWGISSEGRNSTSLTLNDPEAVFFFTRLEAALAFMDAAENGERRLPHWMVLKAALPPPSQPQHDEAADAALSRGVAAQGS